VQEVDGLAGHAKDVDLCRRADGLTGHAKDVGLPHAAYTALIRTTKSPQLIVLRLSVNQVGGDDLTGALHVLQF